MYMFDEVNQQEFESPLPTLLSDQLCPWENNSSKIISHNGELLNGYRCLLAQDENIQKQPQTKKNLKKHRYLRTYQRAFVNLHSYGNFEDTLATGASPSAYTNRCDKYGLSTQFEKDQLLDKQNSFKIRDSLAENRRHMRLEKSLKRINPRRTQSILIDRSRLRSILKDQLSDVKQTPRIKICRPVQSIFVQKSSNKDYKLSSLPFHQSNKMNQDTKGELKFLPEVTKQLYQKYSLNRTRNSFRKKRMV